MHLTNYFDSKGIKHKEHKLESGDYSFFVEALPELGIVRDLYFDKQIIIERKNSLEELSSNFTTNRDRFNNEFLRARDCQKIIVVEKGSMDQLMIGMYNTQLDAKAYLASILSFQHRYGLNIAFVSQDNVARYIYTSFYYYLREIVRR